jgi:H+/Cl- antiporter ClcA
MLFCFVMHKISHFYKEKIKNPYLRIFIAGIIILVLTKLAGTMDYMGAGMDIIGRAIEEGDARYTDFLWKILFTSLTLGAGYRGGEIVPSFFVGATFGCVVGNVMGFSPSLCAAVGMVSVFCGVTNCPITSLFIAAELFGFEGAYYYLPAIAVSYMLSGYIGLYSSQKIMYSKFYAKYINKETE